MKPGEIRKFEVFVSVLCTGNINDAFEKSSNPPNLGQIKYIIDQLFDGLEKLEQAGVCHSDLKPGNILYNLENGNYKIFITDFGQCGKKGGTPGWTAPVFHRERSTREDIYSVGWICLRLLCVSKELFLSLRDNYVENITSPWMNQLRNMTEIEFIYKLIDLDLPLSVEQAKDHWNQIKYGNVQLIDLPRLEQIQVPRNTLTLQRERPRYIFNPCCYNILQSTSKSSEG